ncbi:unnamed protein product, partial [Prorocentrum cordatum]
AGQCSAVQVGPGAPIKCNDRGTSQTSGGGGPWRHGASTATELDASASANSPATRKNTFTSALDLPTLDPNSVPDFEGPELDGVVHFLHQTLSESGPGFFYLKMSDVERDAAETALRLSREQFFALPLKIKMALSNGPDTYFRYNGYRIPSSGPGYRGSGLDDNFKFDSRESFNVGWDTEAAQQAGILAREDVPYGPTPFPDSGAEDFKNSCDLYSQILLERSSWLRRLLARVLQVVTFRSEGGELAEIGFPRKLTSGDPTGNKQHIGFHTLEGTLADDSLFNKAPWLLGFVRYSGVPSNVSERKFGIAPHQDDGVFTLLLTDGSPGLQVCPEWRGTGVHRSEEMFSKRLEWFNVPYKPGHWVVNLGTMLTRWSAGRLKATLHRVVIPEDHAVENARFSMPFFYEPNLDAHIKPMKPIVSSASEDHVDEHVLDMKTPGDIALELAQRDGLTLIKEVGVGITMS